MLQIKDNKQLATSFSRLKYCGENHNYTTRLVTRKLLDINVLNSLPNIIYNILLGFDSYRIVLQVFFLFIFK